MTKSEYLDELERWSAMGARGEMVDDEDVKQMYESIWRAGWLEAVETAIKEVVGAFGRMQGIRVEEFNFEDLTKLEPSDDV